MICFTASLYIFFFFWGLDILWFSLNIFPRKWELSFSIKDSLSIEPFFLPYLTHDPSMRNSCLSFVWEWEPEVFIISVSSLIALQVLSPWWDLVSSGSLQLLTVVALMALSIDVVTKFGTAVKCTPLNGTISFGGSQQVGYGNKAVATLCWLFLVKYMHPRKVSPV